jgi:type IV secretory pathway component VirB8
MQFSSTSQQKLEIKAYYKISGKYIQHKVHKHKKHRRLLMMMMMVVAVVVMMMIKLYGWCVLSDILRYCDLFRHWELHA